MTDQRVLMAVSTVIFTVRPTSENGCHEPWLPLVRRIRDPYRGMWALPGGPLRPNEALEDSALRDLTLTTGLAPTHLEQLATFGGLTRSAGAEDQGVQEFPAILERIVGQGRVLDVHTPVTSAPAARASATYSASGPSLMPSSRPAVSEVTTVVLAPD